MWPNPPKPNSYGGARPKRPTNPINLQTDRNVERGRDRASEHEEYTHCDEDFPSMSGATGAAYSRAASGRVIRQDYSPGDFDFPALPEPVKVLRGQNKKQNSSRSQGDRKLEDDRREKATDKRLSAFSLGLAEIAADIASASTSSAPTTSSITSSSGERPDPSCDEGDEIDSPASNQAKQITDEGQMNDLECSSTLSLGGVPSLDMNRSRTDSPEEWVLSELNLLPRQMEVPARKQTTTSKSKPKVKWTPSSIAELGYTFKNADRPQRNIGASSKSKSTWFGESDHGIGSQTTKPKKQVAFASNADKETASLPNPPAKLDTRFHTSDRAKDEDSSDDGSDEWTQVGRHNQETNPEKSGETTGQQNDDQLTTDEQNQTEEAVVEELTTAKKNRHRSQEVYEDMMDKNKRFFSRQIIYESKIPHSQLEYLFKEVATREMQNGGLRRQFLLRLLKTKFLEMGGPVVGFLMELPRDTTTEEIFVKYWTLLVMLLDLMDEILARIPHHSYPYVTAIKQLLEQFDGIRETELSSRLQELTRNLRDPNLLMNAVNDPTRNWSPDFAFIGEPLIPEIGVLIQSRLEKKFKNVIDRGYGESQKYIEIWFRLMREDFISPLRTAIKDFKGQKPQDKQKCNKIRLDEGYYYKFMGIGETKNEGGKRMELLDFSEFKKEKLKNIDWALTKRLRGEALIVLSDDDFKTATYAIVQRSSEQDHRRKGLVWVKTIDNSPLTFRKAFHGIEPMPFWEPYRCVLERLRYQAAQIANGAPLPMENYLVKLKQNVAEPYYLTEGTVLETRNEDVVVGAEDALSSLPLDESQREALELVLKHELAVIQGPPGCGKSYVGALIVDLLILNKRLWQRHDTGCILLMAYTNHAIDQFVNECEQLGMDMSKTVRIGARGNSSMEKYLLRNRWNDIREMHEYGDISRNGFQARRQLREINAIIDETERTSRMEWLKIPFEVYSMFMSPSAVHQFINEYGEVKHKNIEGWMTGDEGNLSLSDTKPMTFKEASGVKDVFKIGSKKRRQLFAYWCETAKENAAAYLMAARRWREQVRSRVDEIRRNEDEAVVRDSNIIAMTTTGASKHARFLENVQPSIVLVEEAAEVLESHIVAPLTAGCSHLILIGDHQQLRPKISEYRLEKEERNLEISLFERFIMNGMPTRRLEVQHRMHPDIASLLVPHIYPSLVHHPSVTEYPPVRGMKKRMTLIHHKRAEHRIGENSSYTNEFEADFLVATCRYLLQQGYKPQEITILATYAGQARLIRKKIGKSDEILSEEVEADTGDDDLVKANKTDVKTKEENKTEVKNNEEEEEEEEDVEMQAPFREADMQMVKVTTVDNFQGEENKIILLSFVRSNKERQIGFLKSSNRICVALSRAKHGFYAIGDFLLFAKWSDIWGKLCHQLYDEEDPKLSPTLEIVCQQHLTEAEVIDVESFAYLAPEGGCQKACDSRLNCGHCCTRKCHPDDRSHQSFLCMKACPGVLDCGHLCHRPCSVLGDDQNFDAMKKYVLEFGVKPELRHCKSCGKQIDCDVHVDPESPCGHPGNTLCSQRRLYKCQHLMLKDLIDCDHQARMPCSQNPSTFKCARFVEHRIDGCDHRINRECHKKGNACTQLVPQKMKGCDHTIMVMCHRSRQQHKCDVEVEIISSCGVHRRRAQCGNKDEIAGEPCKEEVTRFFDCDHYVRQRCYEELPDICRLRRSKKRDGCDHYVEAMCGEIDKKLEEPCREEVRRYRPCGHFVSVACEENDGRPLNGSCRRFCSLICSHRKNCRGHKCSQPCPPCTKPCQIRCIHACCRRQCYEECDRVPCEKRCTKNLQCGHQCQGLCGEICPRYCHACSRRGGNYDSLRITTLPCRHDLELYEMDQHMAPEENDNVQVLEPKYCPMGSCGALIKYCPRYGNYIKRYLQLVKRRDYRMDDSIRWLYCKRCKAIYKSELSEVLPERHDCGVNKIVHMEEEEQEETEEEEEAPEHDAELENEEWAVLPPEELRNNPFFLKLKNRLFTMPRGPNRRQQRPRPGAGAYRGGNPAARTRPQRINVHRT